MNENLLQSFADKLETLRCKNNHRQFTTTAQNATQITLKNSNTPLLNLASNDYLGIAHDTALHDEFLSKSNQYSLGSASSRLLTGTFAAHTALEQLLGKLFNKSALIFNSGYHANIGIIPAICDSKTLILADKLVHASIIDGIRLSGAKCVRYQHQNLVQLNNLLQKYHDDAAFERIIIITESIFSMDGDVTDLTALVSLKRCYAKVMLYVDEAHAFGLRGKCSLGVADEMGVIDEVDFIVGAFGKAIGSVGGFVACHPLLQQFLVNHSRSLIFSTALPPMNAAWTIFILEKLNQFEQRRQNLHAYSDQLIAATKHLGWQCPSQSQIVPIILGDNKTALAAADFVQRAGFYVLPVRAPTVPADQARLRVCLSGNLPKAAVDDFANCLVDLKNHLQG